MIKVRNGKISYSEIVRLLTMKDFGQSSILECVVVLLWWAMWLEMEKQQGRGPGLFHRSVKRTYVDGNSNALYLCVRFYRLQKAVFSWEVGRAAVTPFYRGGTKEGK